MDRVPEHPAKFSFWVGVSFTLNYVVGSGFLTLPWAFQQTGVFLGLVVLTVFSYFSILAVVFILESMDRASTIYQSGQDVELHTTSSRSYLSINESEDRVTHNVMVPDRDHNPGNSNNSVGASKRDDHSLANGNRRIELTELCQLFLGRNGRNAFSCIISVYMYGTLWAYCTVFSKAFAVQFALTEGEHPEEGASYYFYLFIFGCLVIPLSLMELSEQIYVQVTLTIFRGVMLVVMLLTTGLAYASHGTEFGSMSNTSGEQHTDTAGSDLFAVHFDKLYLFLPIAAYAYIFHHSVPALSEPVEDKRSLSKMFTVALLIAFVGYALLGVCVSLYFGNHVLSSSNLNWRDYEGVRNADGSVPFYAPVIACFVVLFPALDVGSAYPLNAFTLGNNLMSAFYGDEMHVHEKSRFKLRLFRLCAALPPFLGACVVRDLGNITAFTGLTGFAIAFVVPALLAYYSAQRMRVLDLDETTVHSSKYSGTAAQYLLCCSGTLLVIVVAVCNVVYAAPGRR